MTPPSPARALAVSLVVVGIGAVYTNLDRPDESLQLGIIIVVLGIAALLLPETPRRIRALEIVAVLLLVLTGGEASVRRENGIAAKAYAERTMHFVDDPLLRYEMKPGLVCDKSVTNSFGMLDAPRELAKAPGTLRVACLGDSVGGDCSLPQDNACASLEPVLQAALGGRPVEALNFSVPGYNTMQEARSLELKALRFDPDVVVVLYVLNDPGPELAISHYLPGHFKFEHLLWRGARLAAGKLLGPDVDPLGGLFLQLHESPSSWDAVVVAGFDRIQAVALARHIPVVVAVFPLFVGRAPPGYPGIYAKVVAEAERHGFVGVDLSQAAFRDEPVAELLKPSRDMIHPNARAHHLAAAAIVRALLDRHPELAH